MPGKKDFKTIMVGNKRTAVQKRLLLVDLRELYSSYKEIHPDKKVGFSTFCKLRPKNVILMGASGTYAVCVCTQHENVKMMLEAIDIKNVPVDNPMKDYRDCLKMIMCKNPLTKCHLHKCDECPGVQSFYDKIYNHLENSNISHVEYLMWTATDRSTLLNLVITTEDFVDELCERLTALKTHSYVAKAQSAFINKRKENLKDHEMLIMFDYSENYKYVA